MIHFRCECGAGQSVQESVAAEVNDCPACGAPLRLAWVGTLPEDANFHARLILLEAPDESDMPLQTQLLVGGEGDIVLGKEPGDGGIRLPGRLVSRCHCRMTPGAAGWRVEDQNSRNGLFVNGQRLQAHELKDGDVLRVGEYQFSYHASATRTAGPRPVAGQAFQPATPEVAAADAAVLRLAPEKPARPRPAPARAAPVQMPAAPLPPPAAEPAMPQWQVGAEYEPELEDRLSSRRAAARRPSAAPVAPPPVGPPVVCPSCTRNLTPGTKICVACGIDIATGRPILISREVDEDKFEAGAHETLQILSWIVFFGLCPIASEAYGSKRPYAVWAIAALTAFITVAVWVHDRRSSPSLEWSMAQWTGRVTSRHVRERYEDPDFEGHPAQVAYEQKKQELKEVVPEQQLPLAAYQALPPQHRLFGRPEFYQLFTHTLVHQDILHLAGNLVFLLVFGSRVNALIGQWKTALLYPVLGALSGWVDAVASASADPTPVIGASGAIMGLAGMYLVLFPVHRVYSVAWMRAGLFTVLYKVFAVRGFWIVAFFIAWDAVLVLASAQDHVAHWAHLGGFAAGVLLAVVLLVARAIDARGGDLLSVALGQRAWLLLGTPARRQRAQLVA